jgi:hypothetical protein
MRSAKRQALTLMALAALTASAALAESRNPADYPLRLHIYGRNEVTFFHNRNAEEAKGDGRANLYESGEPHGVDFNFDCDHKLRTSFGYETYPAKWKKPGRELVVLMPIFGQAGSFYTCTFHTDVKTFAYGMKNGSLLSEPSDRFKEWMLKHNYDPEHGKDMPTATEPRPTP